MRSISSVRYDPGAHIGDATSRERPTRSGLGSASSCFAKLGRAPPIGRISTAAGWIEQRPLAGSNKASAHELVTLEVQDVHLAGFGSWDASCALLHIERKSWGARKPQGGWC
jgi:hypothetical protein